jgi:hypothetical protein
MPPKKISVDRADAHKLVYTEFYSLAEQADAADNVRALLGDSVAELDRKRRQELNEPVQVVTVGTDNEIIEPTEADEKRMAKEQAATEAENKRRHDEWEELVYAPAKK